MVKKSHDSRRFRRTPCTCENEKTDTIFRKGLIDWHRIFKSAKANNVNFQKSVLQSNVMARVRAGYGATGDYMKACIYISLVPNIKMASRRGALQLQGRNKRRVQGHLCGILQVVITSRHTAYEGHINAELIVILERTKTWTNAELPSLHLNFRKCQTDVASPQSQRARDKNDKIPRFSPG